MQDTIKELYFSPDGKNSFYEKIQDNLYEGLELKNYNSLCSLLDLEKPYPHSNAKIRHMTAWHCFFDYEYIPDTHRIRINKIYPYNEIKEYDSPISHGKPKTQKFHFYSYFIPLLEDYSARNGYQYTLTLSNADLFILLGFVNELYAEFYDTMRSLCKKHEREEDNVEYFELYNIFSRLLTSEIIPKQCQALKNQKILIDRKDIFIIKKTDNYMTMKATDGQTELIHDIKNHIAQNRENLYNGTHPLAIATSNDTLINAELEKRGIDFRLHTTTKEYTFSKDSFHPHRLDDEIADTYRRMINEYFIENKLKKKLDNIQITSFNRLNKKYKDKSLPEIKQMMIDMALNMCKI